MTQQPSIERIVREKGGEQNNSQQRDLTLKARAWWAMGSCAARKSKFARRMLKPGSSARVPDPLVDKVHVNLGMLRGVAYSENEIGRFLTHGNDGMFGEDGANLTEAERRSLQPPRRTRAMASGRR